MTMTTDMVFGSNPSEALLQYKAVAKELGQLQAEEGADPMAIDALKKQLDDLYSKLTQDEKNEVAGENSQE
jgi:hypothetical protein